VHAYSDFPRLFSYLTLLYAAPTIQARVQNQMYQQADQATMAQGANVVNVGQSKLVQVEAQNIDLTLLRDRVDPDQPLTSTGSQITSSRIA
jgi:hypothetical protein